MFCHSIFVVEGKWSSILTFSKSFGCAHSFSLFSSDSSFAEQREPFVVELQPEHFQSAEGSLKFLPTLSKWYFQNCLCCEMCQIQQMPVDWTLGQWRRWGARIRCKICKQGWKTQFPVPFRQNTCFFKACFLAPFCNLGHWQSTSASSRSLRRKRLHLALSTWRGRAMKC